MRLPSLPLSVAGLDLSIYNVQCKTTCSLYTVVAISLDVVLLVAAEDPLDLPPADMHI